MKINFNKELALSLNDTYLKAYPYPHVSIDNFIDKEDIKECVSEMGLFNSWGFDPSEYSAQYQQKKFFYLWGQGSEEIKETLSSMPQPAGNICNILILLIFYQY